MEWVLDQRIETSTKEDEEKKYLTVSLWFVFSFDLPLQRTIFERTFVR
jgi:hypothetical protein